MKVKELIEELKKCNPNSEVLFYQYDFVMTEAKRVKEIYVDEDSMEMYNAPMNNDLENLKHFNKEVVIIED